jgi:hypothetical protein
MTRPTAQARPAPRMRRFWLVALAAAAAAGCEDLRPQLQQLQQDNARLSAKVQELQQALTEKDRQIRTLQGLGSKRLELLFHVKKLELGRYTAGVNLDGKPGDEGVRVYLRPLDADGHPIKAAGKVRIQLFDLSRNENNLLAEHVFGVEKTAQHWFGAFLAYHYRFDCRWAAAPDRPDVTVRAAFTDYLTGREFTAQKVCKVSLPAAGQAGK